MEIDLRTMYIAHALVSATLAALMAVFWRGHRSMPGLGHWTLGAVLIGAMILGGGLRGLVPAFVSVIVPNCLGIVGVAAFRNGIRRFDGRPARWLGTAATTVAVAAFVLHRTYVVDAILDRIIVVSAVLSFGCALCAWELLRGPARTLKATALPAAVVFLLVAATLGARAGWTALDPPEPDLFARTAVQSTHFVVSLVANILVVVSVLMMAAQRLQWELEARNAALEEARARAEHESRAKSDFLANMSHELRTPLNAIIGFSDVQRQGIFGALGHPRYQEYAENIHASGTHLLDLITTILDLSKAEAGKLEISPVDVDPLPILEASVMLVRGAAQAKRIDLAVTEAAATRCHADPQALKQILVNLLSNAVKFTPENGLVEVALRPSADGGTELVVRDSGIGMDSASLPRLMKPFEQARRGYSRGDGGTGLGLPLVQSLVRLHHGTLEIDTALGKGTVATVRLPPVPQALAAE